ncbi:proline-serine-threonine phosphatase-interacting protein 1-like [Ostrea edulis]|uniref:proline-serine-threonine phosphatase-interacting protein 1-like n=1 Tax=Ostrea edulis TaxID=37623 RepID=UPI002095187D|nr:proline-serine-threonine phosphatase-interacting protein 1-like [Ostrea edulis]XP_048742621.1 proline-serine-threonine phosphatase-interacting protein 1-like [Ostrea edulis]XP_056004989.1 proline-serine-threonine phosphatase-interacting protein 1-like [Ostrea edulis]XP_056004995.1 proline-serine-threonine phosphatase-interacting protein 1-like [Ostrea edulis]XP_056004999.1 proline-serine-threonine phosphatase-interacting protein 1-like [Ostrea edulis]XP_056005006.1 proline-serine-threonine 
MQTSRYKDSFWDRDINSSKGYDELKNRMKEGRKLSNEVETYFRQRAKIEKDYSKDLQKLVENCKLKTELGSLEKAWKEVKIGTSKIAQVHETAGVDFEKLAQEVSSFTDEQKRQVKAMEETVQKLHSSLKSVHNKLTSQEKTYHQKGEEYDKLQNSLKFSENNRGQVQPKELDKLRIKESRAKDDMEKNESSYKHLIEEFNKSRAVFEKEMTIMCELFQELDEKRIDHTRDNLWKCTNVDSRTCIDQDECAERIRHTIEPCDIDRDIQLFIKTYKTGSDKPRDVIYKPCRGSRKSDFSGGDHLYSEVTLHG